MQYREERAGKIRNEGAGVMTACEQSFILFLKRKCYADRNAIVLHLRSVKSFRKRGFFFKVILKIQELEKLTNDEIDFINFVTQSPLKIPQFRMIMRKFFQNFRNPRIHVIQSVPKNRRRWEADQFIKDQCIYEIKI